VGQEASLISLALVRDLWVVFDTNVIVSALVVGLRLAWLRTAWAAGTATSLVCRQTTTELLRVLS